MSNYHQLYYHATWATKGRESLINQELQETLYKYIRGKILDFGGIAFVVGGTNNHIHVVMSIPPHISVASFIGKLKGSSSHWVSHIERPGMDFGWQDGYGAFTLIKDILETVKAYVENQEEHHSFGSLRTDLEI